MWSIVALLFFAVTLVSGNTEKVIFLGPSSLQIPVEHPTLEDLHLDTLSPQHWALRTYLPAEFPKNNSKHGVASWFILHRLEEGQRYEVRVCWAATQPTSFRLETYDLPQVFETPELITSLAQYSEARQQDPEDSQAEASGISRRSSFRRGSDDLSSTLFLQIFAAADYYTTNKTLMKDVPPVYVDIILDPFIFNVLPRSLLPTVAYIILLAIGSWYISAYISKWLRGLATEPSEGEKKNK
ncbi:hypothetical protein GLAREA_05607 [Glarea lozoyensis ATCC 20868]|uniref:Uncharacterized protein n=1 Tax=Glarea lozoyensis (strain ATCC 20868 / MF5171) TaxID=1116229 RepID=S3DGL1_GLAL2|nr:uncharacterized protein GLAREA_05607 [Glarea lozoyensis ATCC 20868]EPE36269.1 hypothetical protein GLAREA_05607 [Glarea lozoyensis ATCC 20868]